MGVGSRMMIKMQAPYFHHYEKDTKVLGGLQVRKS